MSETNLAKSDINNIDNDNLLTCAVSTTAKAIRSDLSSSSLSRSDQSSVDIDPCNKSAETDPHTREGRCTSCMKIFQSCLSETVTKCRPIIKTIVKALPVIMASVAIILMGADQSTDVNSSYKICNVQCKCAWDEYSCFVPFGSDGKDHPCYDVFGNNTNSNDYCDTGGWNQTVCNKLEWSPASPRHPAFCYASIATILMPSIINSTYLLVRIWLLYPTILKYLELTEGIFIMRLLKITLLVLYILQLLPYAWLTMIIFINIKIWRNGTMNELDDKEILLKRNRIIKFVFFILEDTPQTIVHSMLIIYSVLTHDLPAFSTGIDMLDPGSFFGLATSAFSITLTMILFKRPSSSKTAAIQFFTTFISVGTRALVCASYATVVIGYASSVIGFASAVNDSDSPDTVVGQHPQTWNLILPPVAALSLFLIESVLILFYKLVKTNLSSLEEMGLSKHIRDQINSFDEWVKKLKYTYCIQLLKVNASKFITNIVSLSFEANSAQSLITSYTYLAFAVAINTMPLPNLHMTHKTFLIIQYLALASYLLNWIVVQSEAKHKYRCLSYALIFLVFMAGTNTWLKKDNGYFVYLFYSATPNEAYDPPSKPGIPYGLPTPEITPYRPPPTNHDDSPPIPRIPLYYDRMHYDYDYDYEPRSYSYEYDLSPSRPQPTPNCTYCLETKCCYPPLIETQISNNTNYPIEIPGIPYSKDEYPEYILKAQPELMGDEYTYDYGDNCTNCFQIGCCQPTQFEIQLSESSDYPTVIPYYQDEVPATTAFNINSDYQTISPHYQDELPATTAFNINSDHPSVAALTSDNSDGPSFARQTSLTSIRPIFYTAVIISSVDLLIVIIDVIRSCCYRKFRKGEDPVELVSARKINTHNL